MAPFVIFIATYSCGDKLEFNLSQIRWDLIAIKTPPCLDFWPKEGLSQRAIEKLLRNSASSGISGTNQVSVRHTISLFSARIVFDRAILRFRSMRLRTFSERIVRFSCPFSQGSVSVTSMGVQLQPSNL